MIRGLGYSRSEVDELLGIIEDRLSYSMADWDCVQQRHAKACCNEKGENNFFGAPIK
jgi:hypothetical protein